MTTVDLSKQALALKARTGGKDESYTSPRELADSSYHDAVISAAVT